MVLGFVSIFLAWIVNDLFGHLEITLANYIEPDAIWYLLQIWPMMLAPISGLIFLSGCILLLFTRWGVIAQIIGLATFTGFYLWWSSDEMPTHLGIGFYVGIISAIIIIATILIERRLRAPSEVINT